MRAGSGSFGVIEGFRSANHRRCRRLRRARCSRKDVMSPPSSRMAYGNRLFMMMNTGRHRRFHNSFDDCVANRRSVDYALEGSVYRWCGHPMVANNWDSCRTPLRPGPAKSLTATTMCICAGADGGRCRIGIRPRGCNPRPHARHDEGALGTRRLGGAGRIRRATGPR